MGCPAGKGPPPVEMEQAVFLLPKSAVSQADKEPWHLRTEDPGSGCFVETLGLGLAGGSFLLKFDD